MKVDDDDSLELSNFCDEDDSLELSILSDEEIHNNKKIKAGPQTSRKGSEPRKN